MVHVYVKFSQHFHIIIHINCLQYTTRTEEINIKIVNLQGYHCKKDGPNVPYLKPTPSKEFQL